MYIAKPGQLLIIKKKNNNEVQTCLRTFEIHSNENLVDKYSNHLFMALMLIGIQGVIWHHPILWIRGWSYVIDIMLVISINKQNIRSVHRTSLVCLI